ncbi:MAG: hypothetical protein EA409_09395 [Saprospirales bacterium]|nr:MAG: hypothetical protein EA409_09395 [Saprospirales bacterium]
MKHLLTLFFGVLLFAGTTSEVHAQKVTDYETSIGIRLGWGFTFTGKHFINDAHAIEGILNYRWGWTRYNQTRIAAVYQIHGDLSDVFDGLAWYWGFGGVVGFESYSSRFSDASTQVFFGVVGAIGLDYALQNTPVNVSVDFMPNFVFGDRISGLSGSRGFRGDMGGVAVRYILK